MQFFKFFYMSVHSSIFKYLQEAFHKLYTKFLLSSFHCFEAVFYTLNSQLVSLTTPAHTNFNFCCYASSLPFCSHTSRMRNEVQVR